MLFWVKRISTIACHHPLVWALSIDYAISHNRGYRVLSALVGTKLVHPILTYSESWYVTTQGVSPIMIG